MTTPVVLRDFAARLPVRRGKVRDVYDLGERLLLVSTDRISAFDWVLPTGIPDKGRVLTQIAAFWFELPGRAEPSDHHRRGADGPARRRRIASCWPAARRSAARRRWCPSSASSAATWPAPAGRSIGKSGTVCGIRLPAGLTESAAAAGADLHARHQGRERARREHLLRADGRARRPRAGRRVAAAAACDIFRRGAEYARQRGIIIADTKFEWGQRRRPDSS